MPVRTLAREVPNSHEYTSVTLAIEKPASAEMERNLLAPVFLFGKRCYIRLFAIKKPLLQCTRCWELGHGQAVCKTPYKCNHCGGKHATHNHTAMCPGVARTQECLCVHKCVNCGGKHKSSDPDCPEKRKYTRVAPGNTNMSV